MALISTSAIGPAYANDPEDASAAESVAEVSPIAAHFDDLETQESAVDGNVVSLPGDPDDLTIELPVSDSADSASEDGLVSLSDDESYSVVPAVLDDGSVAIHSVLHDSSAPASFEYVYNLPAGVNLELQDNGGAAAFNQDGSVAVMVAAPWATDANGETVATYYTAKGNALTQHVIVTENSAFPIVADPWNGIDLVAKWSFTSVSGKGWKLNVDPTLWARSYTTSPNFQPVGEAGWLELKIKMPAKYEVRLNLSGKQQYICHMGWAGTDAQWNMELWKPSKANTMKWVSTFCNWELQDAGVFLLSRIPPRRMIAI